MEKYQETRVNRVGKGPNKCGQGLRIEFGKMFENIVEAAKSF